MILKILKIDCEDMSRNNNDYSAIADRIKEHKSFDSNMIHIYSMYIKTSGNSIGARDRNEGNYEGLTIVMDELEYDLVKCRFIIVDTRNCNVYYDGNLTDVTLILKDFFSVNSSQISHVIERDDLEKIKSLKLTTKSEGQMVLNEPVNPEMEMIDSIFESERIKTRSYELFFGDEGSRFIHRDRFNNLMDDSAGSRTIITAKGFDAEGRQVVLGSQISKKVELLKEYSSWNDKVTLPLETIYEELRREVTL
ncbi:hypothetical protein G7061_07945 [Erysipelothrix sp. HDW6B]|uniref:hypothetical protein n=1 Tax=Erysipelothrix sp. HDW6B TaxID=2714929 RepID=UPI00140B0B0D|nr:hypothetical protein [Erysipelothrix sp. HDW6B]QIK86544.1 hypothetical protein G7061_07945 [Erysipelothrix sp. HDW6B]